MEKFEEEVGDFTYAKRLGIGFGFLIGLLISGVTWIFIILMVFGCSPVITNPYGYVILTNSHRIAVEHERADKEGHGIVRVYEFPFGHDYVVGDSLCVGGW